MDSKTSTVDATYQKQIHVKLSTLRAGIGTVFSGVLTMLEALDTETAKSLVERFVQEDVGKEERTDEVKPSESGTVDTAGAVSSDSPAVDDDVPDELTDQKESERQTASAPNVTQDDITKGIRSPPASTTSWRWATTPGERLWWRTAVIAVLSIWSP